MEEVILKASGVNLIFLLLFQTEPLLGASQDYRGPIMVCGKSLERAGETSVGARSRLPCWCGSVSRADILDPHRCFAFEHLITR